MKKQILVIDEGRLMCYGLKKALSQELTEVDTAFTVRNALTSYGSNNYDLCLFDVCPPDDKGFELMEMIRNSWPNMRIILMTATDITLYHNPEEIIHKAKKNGASHLLCKPFELQLLKDVVYNILQDNCDDSWYKENFVICNKRMATRKKWCKKINFSVKVIKDGGVKRLHYPAESVNISDDGIELITAYLLKPAEVVCFDDDDLGRKEGLVIWSNRIDDQRYMAGIQFA